MKSGISEKQQTILQMKLEMRPGVIPAIARLESCDIIIRSANQTSPAKTMQQGQKRPSTTLDHYSNIF
jgi:hypothetical protein